MDQYSSEYSSKTILDSHYQVVSNMNSSLFNKYYYSSWQEQAVFVWPPRCYCCSFCKREFKSAQALGGHMNVHRRDRARLKHQSQNQAHDEPLSKSQSKATTLPKSQKQSPARLKSKTVALMTNSSTLSLGEPTNISHISSPIIKKRLCSDSDLKRRSDEKGAAKEVILLDDHEYVEANRSVVISMAASEYSKGQNRSMFSSFPLLHKPYCWSGNNYFSNNNMPNHISREVELHTDLTSILGKVEHGKYCFSTSEKVGIRTSSMEDIDLELRLGDPPAISS